MGLDISSKLADLAGHIPFLLVTYHDDQGRLYNHNEATRRAR